MARLSASPRSSVPVPTRFRIAQPPPDSEVLQHAKSAAPLPKKPTKLSPPSSERTFLCQDKQYPFARSRLPRPSPTSSATPNVSVHWRGNEHALFKLSRAAKCDIQNYLLTQCAAQSKGTNEFTKPTGTKFVYVLQLDEDQDEEQEALCFPTNAATLDGIYRFRNVAKDKDITKSSELPISATYNMQDVTRRYPRSRGTTSFARMMAGANEEGFPHADQELDSDSEGSDDLEESPPPPYTTILDAITEVNEDEEADDSFVDVVDYGAPKCGRNPHFAGHPECRGRHKTDSYVHNAVDAELDLQQCFVTAHNGDDSVAHYRNWRTLKWDHSETMVHGQSLLRTELVVEDDAEQELDDPTEQLIRQIDAKYGPLTWQGQSSSGPARSEVKCSEECNFKINRFLDLNPEDNPWLSSQLSMDDHEDALSVPSTLFVGVADLSDDDSPAPAMSQSRTAPVMSEEALQKILNTPHEAFIEHYVQRQQAKREQAAREERSRDSADCSPIAAHSATEAPRVAVNVVPEEAVSPSHVSIPPPESTTTLLVESAPTFLPVFIQHEAAPIEVSIRPASALTSRSSRDDLSIRTSVFSKRASVTTKPSNESFGSDSLRLVETFDFEGEFRTASAPASNDRRVTSMPVLTSLASDMCDMAAGVSALNQIAPGEHTNAVPSIPVRTAEHIDYCLTSVIEVQIQLESSLNQPAEMYASNPIADQTGTLPAATEEQRPGIGTWPEVVRQSQEQKPATTMQPHFSSVINESYPTATRQRWSSKIKASVKNRVQSVSGAAKKGTRRIVRSTKKLGATVRYLVPVASAARNPYESIALA